MKKILTFLGLLPNDHEKEILMHLSKTESRSMRVVGKGRLTINVMDVRATKKSKKLIEMIDKYVE